MDCIASNVGVVSVDRILLVSLEWGKAGGGSGFIGCACSGMVCVIGSEQGSSRVGFVSTLAVSVSVEGRGAVGFVVCISSSSLVSAEVSCCWVRDADVDWP